MRGTVKRNTVAKDVLNRGNGMKEFARGGGPLTLIINQRFGSVLASAGARAGFHPNDLSIASGLIGVATSFLVLAWHAKHPIVAAAIGIIGWHLAYSLDCADGQLARATKTSSASGAALDLLIDFIVHVSMAFALLEAGFVDWFPPWKDEVDVAVASSWLIGPFFEGLASNLAPTLKDSLRRGPRVVIRTLRDFSLHISLLPLLIPISRHLLIGALILVASIHYLALISRIASFWRNRF